MKKLLITICILAMASFAGAATNLTFQCDKNTEPDLAGYNVYRSDTSGDYTDVTPLNFPIASLADPDNPSFTEESVPDGTWFWVATAYDIYGNESVYSDELTETLDTTAPGPPQNFTIWQKIIAWLCNVFGIC